MTSVEGKCAVRSSALQAGSIKKKTLFEETGLGAFHRFFDDCMETARSDDGGDGGPPRKRQKRDQSENVTAFDPRTTTAGIPIARLGLQLTSESLSSEGKWASASGAGSSEDIEAAIVDVADASGVVKVTIASPPSVNKSMQLVFELPDLADRGCIDMLQNIAYLERRTKSRKKGVAYPDCRLIRLHGPGDTRFRLEGSIMWVDGESGFGPLAIQDTDVGLLMQSYPYHDSAEAWNPRLRGVWEWTPQDFYESVYAPTVDTVLPEILNEDILATKLYPFQKRAVAWMLQRENPIQQEVRMSFTKVRDANGKDCYFSHLEGAMCLPQNPSLRSHEPKGGILAEEMGLGKTCELIALICLNRRKEGLPFSETGQPLIPSRATLIVTPETILQQWMDELQKHAPWLKVLRYTGISNVAKFKKHEKKLLADFADMDVVITTYPVLSKEVHFAVDPPERNLRRRETQHKRARSPLVRMHWWRVCLDEAQMVESGVSAAAKVAVLLPRENAWAVTGTPLKKDVADLLGLLIFLRYTPFCDSVTLWNRLIFQHKDAFKELFGRIALRHTKDMIRHELRLPPQRRVVLTMPFTTIEEQNYKNLFEEMCAEVGCAPDGSPAYDNWSPESSNTIERMRSWLVRLRQTCLHPQVGGRNKKALGRGNGPLRTVAEVLAVMIDQNETAIRVESRVAIGLQLLQAHIIANAKDDDWRAEHALEVYKDALREAEGAVAQCRADLAGLRQGNQAVNEEEPEEEGSVMRSRAALHSALQMQHACAFFVGTAYFQIKSNESITPPESDSFRELEEQETAFYDTAKTIRKELLRDSATKAERLMEKVEDHMKMRLPDSVLSQIDMDGGIESRRILTKAEDLADILDGQAVLLNEWKAKVIELLLKPLVDEDEGVETTGDEYEDSTKQQDTLYAYIDAFRAVVADRGTCITGQGAPLIDHEMNMLVRDAKEEKGHAPELVLKLLARRSNIKQQPDELVSLRGLTHEARGLETMLEMQDRSTRAAAELAIVQKQIKALGKIRADETKTMAELEKALEHFRACMNQRLEFYRQLQYISDTVAPYKEVMDEMIDEVALNGAKTKLEEKNKVLAQLKTKHRFLVHLRDESSSSEAERICVICQCPFEQGVLTICGHQYCKECIRHWWSQHKTCPVCKRRLTTADFHNVTYKPQELRGQEEASDSSSSSSPNRSEKSLKHSSSLYSDIGTEILNQIKSIDLKGSYGTKIDTLSRHILWLREHDAGAKAIVFSQYREFLDVLSTAFKQFGIGFSRMGTAGAINRFKQDASVEVFLLDAKTDSSGLNLVNAQYVFLAEPLINTAIELQAIARVHRIGQQRPTTVYMYLTSDTVEEAIYEISVTRRLAHMQKSRHASASGKSQSTTPVPGEEAIDAANSLEMQQAPLSKLLTQGKGGGEMVAQHDLWGCLFGKTSVARKVAGADVSEGLQTEVGRHLRGEAAVERRDNASNGLQAAVEGHSGDEAVVAGHERCGRHLMR